MDIKSVADKDNFWRFLPVAFVIVATLIWSLYIFNKSAPNAEGTYMVYANLILAGQMPYSDFEFLYTPLFTYIITGLTALFGPKAIAMRAFGAFLYVVVALEFYMIFKVIAGPRYAAIMAVPALLVTMSDAFNLIDDYHALNMAVTLALFYFLLISIKLIKEDCELNKKRIVINTALSGFFGSLCFLIKPPGGAVLIVFTIISIHLAFALFRKDKHYEIAPLIAHITAFVIPIAICFLLIAVFSSFDNFVQMVFNGGSKGSLLSILTRFTFDIFKIPAEWLLVIVVIIAVRFIARCENHPDDDEMIIQRRSLVAFSLITIIMMTVIVCIPTLADKTLYSVILSPLNEIFMISLTIEIILLVWSINGAKKYSADLKMVECAFILGAFIAFAYTCLLSGELNHMPIGALSAFLILVILSFVHKIPVKKTRVILKHGIMIIPVAFVISSVMAGIICPYSWWCSEEPPTYDCNSTTNIPYFDGMLMSAEEKEVYETFVSICDAELTENDEMYCYANTICFYTIANKLPVVDAVIPWFDICRQDTLLSDLDYLQNNNPKLIVFTDHGQLALDLHSDQYGDKYGNRAMYEWLLFCVNDPGSQYHVAYTYDLGAPGYILVRN